MSKTLKKNINSFSAFFNSCFSTSSIAWLLDPAVKKIFIEKDQVFTLYIPILIIIAFE